jgi:hypothetical protein
MRADARIHRTLLAVLVLAVPLFGSGAAVAAESGDGRRVQGEVIDITGLMERPRGDTRLPWTLPEGFARSPEAPGGRALREEVLRPVERAELQRLLEVERLLSR